MEATRTAGSISSKNPGSEAEKRERIPAESLQTKQENDSIVENDNGLEKENNPGDADPWTETYFPDPEINTPTLLETVGWWAEFTSIHGVYYSFERGHFRPWKQIAWSVLVLAATACLIWVLVVEFQEYYEFHLNTSIETIVPSSLVFPQVTLCNANMFDSSLQNKTGIQEPRTLEELESISQPFEEFIHYTALNGVPYQDLARAWTPVITHFGRCYTYSTDAHVFKPGSTAGLDFLVWLNQSNYDEKTLVAGINVFITEPGSIITDQTAPVLVPPGAASSILVSLLTVEREQEDPWRRCHGTSPEYTNELCRAECINAATREACNCRLIGDDESTDMRYCNSNDYSCKMTVGDQALSECDCATPPCEEKIYVARYSAAQISLKAANSLEEKYNFPEGELVSNVVSVNVNYDSIRYDKMTESKATSAPQLVSNLGGSMGFFMGISLISIVEVLGELLCLRLIPRWLFGNKHLYGVGQVKTD